MTTSPATAAPARISHRELRNDSAEVLRRVAAGEVIEVTNHGDVVAVLTPPDMPEIARLRLSARTRPPARSWTGPWASPRQRSTLSTAQMIDDVRGDR